MLRRVEKNAGCLISLTHSHSLTHSPADSSSSNQRTEKRNRRNPDGPYWGNSPIWGALVTTVCALAAGGLLSYAIGALGIPLPPKVSLDAMGLFVLTITLGFTALFVK